MNRPVQIKVVHSAHEPDGTTQSQQMLTLSISGAQRATPYLIQRSYEDLLSFARQMKRALPSLPAVPRRAVKRLSGHVKNDVSQQKPRRMLESYFQSAISGAHTKEQAIRVLDQFVDHQSQFCRRNPQSEETTRAKALNQYFTSTGTTIALLIVRHSHKMNPNRKCNRSDRSCHGCTPGFEQLHFC
jgi:hypothetical protein